MQTSLNRRSFFSRLGLSMLAAGVASGPAARVAAMEPIVCTGPARLRLSLAGYSFRNFFKDTPGGNPPQDAARAIDLFDFIDFCMEQECDAEPTSYYFPPEVDEAFLLRLKRHAYLRGVVLSGTAVGNTFTLPKGDQRAAEIAKVKRWVDHSATMGAPHVRVFAGNQPQGISLERARAHCIEALEECCDYAGGRGVFLGLENHGGIVAEPEGLLEIVRAVRSPWLGINLDSGNFHTRDPYADLVRCLPYAVNVQIKVEMQPEGAARGPADLPRIVRLLKEGGYQGFVALEYEAAEDPWGAVPRYLSRLRELIQG